MLKNKKNMARKKGNYFVDPKEFRAEIIKSKQQDELTPRALELLMLMTKRLTDSKFSYKYKEDKDDCMAFAHLDIVSYWRKFDPDKSFNPFAYFTRMILNGLAKGFKKLHPHSVTKSISISNTNIYNI